ncbi:PREDICTED: uncharacterized protein LOC104799547 [Tarenaya hassleriana]|uniref:uncharacterized protein LOC104799547 n=1 Tax=Tarenaya hassleriana TaxID=28532 RepID=UPI00053C783D|nr:PREDICTED: uncharacterized protein LOC104799547 [Tarenaya hassleriana]XP_010520431.1 PREDICTED: uncharacterized protein LOC104799547 [Tarenaya hassleriana]
MMMLLPVTVAVAVCLIGYVYRSLKPPPPRICGAHDGPRVTSPRIKLGDGRHLAYREVGVPKDEAKYKIIVVHGFNSSKDVELPIPQELIDEYMIYFLYFDRAGYGESDPYPSRSVKTEAYDIRELADKLQIGSKFYLLGISLGAYPVYSCLKYIPHRLAGAAMVVPFVNYWWTGVPRSISRKGFERLLRQDQWAFRVAHHAPCLFYWWMTQKFFPSLSIVTGNTSIFSDHDMDIIRQWMANPSPGMEKIRQQGDHESLHRDVLAGYGKWEFDPTELENPFPTGEGSVHIWQGLEDRIIPRVVNRHISQKLPWIKYHEVSGFGHFLMFEKKNCEDVLKALLVG